jgi:hypothetical protein
MNRGPQSSERDQSRSSVRCQLLEVLDVELEPLRFIFGKSKLTQDQVVKVNYYT